MTAGNHHLDIAILGGGFAGVYCAKTLRRQFGANAKYRVGLISQENYMVFQPMLPEVAGASISPRHVVNPLRLLCPGTDVFKGTLERIDWPAKRLVLHAGAFAGHVEITFDHLVLALGAEVDLSRIPGMPEHASLMQNVGDAMLLRTTIIGRIEEANLESRPEIKERLLTFVVVGGGYSGVETAGQILDLFRSIHVYYPNVSASDLRVFLVHSRDHLLPTLSRSLGEYTAEKLKARGLNLVLNQRVKAVTAHRVYLQDGSTIDANTVISTVGNAPHPLIMELCRQNDLPCEKGRILTDNTGRVPGQSRLWAAGDCAATPFVGGGFCPDTAQFAMRQGILVGKNIVRTISDDALCHFTFKGFGEMAAIGHHTAVGDLFGIQFSGFLAWWMWRSIYLLKLPRFDRKLRVMLDWTLDLFFPRDINLLSPRYSSLLKEIHLEKGDVLFRQGEPAFSLYIVKSGSIELSDEQGVVNHISKGEYVGERALLEDGVFHFSAHAAEPSTLVSIPAKIFYQLVRGCGSLGRLFQQSAAKYQSREIIDSITRRISPEALRLKAGDVMQTDLTTLRPSMSLDEAVTLTKERPHSLYPMVDEGNCLLGVVKREDFYELLKTPNISFQTRLDVILLSPVPTIDPSTPVNTVMEKFIRGGTNKLLVTDHDHHLAGIITVMDLLAVEKNHAGKGAEG